MIAVGGGGGGGSSSTQTDYNSDGYVNFLPAPKDRIINLVYPVNSLYFSTNNVNPGTIFGGTWVSWGTGRMVCGVDPNNKDMNSASKTGGSFTHTHTGPSHTHTIASHNHTMAHTHTGPSHTHTGPNHVHTTGNCTLTVNQIPAHEHILYAFGYDGESTTPNQWRVGFGSVGLRDNLKTRVTGGSQAHNHGNTGYSGTGATGASGTGTTSRSSATNTGGSGTLTSAASGTGNTGSASSLPPYITCYIWRRTA